MDSGATSHMTSNKDFFNTLESKRLPKVTLADGEEAEAKGIGSGEIQYLDEKKEEIIIKLTYYTY